MTIVQYLSRVEPLSSFSERLTEYFFTCTVPTKQANGACLFRSGKKMVLIGVKGILQWSRLIMIMTDYKCL